MKRRFGSVVVMGLAGLSVLGCAGQQGVMKQGPSFVVTTPVLVLSPGGKVAMYGTGFAPKQEVTLLFKDAGGGMSSIASVVKPPPVANQEGAWAGEWDLSSYVRVLKPGTGMLTATDKDFNPLGQAPVVLVAPPAKPPAKPPAGAPKR